MVIFLSRTRFTACCLNLTTIEHEVSLDLSTRGQSTLKSTRAGVYGDEYHLDDRKHL